jgi:hypothetical protein
VTPPLGRTLTAQGVTGSAKREARAYGRRGVNGSCSWEPGRTTSAVDTGTSSHAPETSAKDSETTSRLLGEPLEAGVVRVQCAHSADALRDEQRAGVVLGRVSDRPELLAVAEAHRSLERMLDSVPLACGLYEADRTLHRPARILLEPEGQRQVEEDLGRTETTIPRRGHPQAPKRGSCLCHDSCCRRYRVAARHGNSRGQLDRQRRLSLRPRRLKSGALLGHLLLSVRERTLHGLDVAPLRLALGWISRDRPSTRRSPWSPASARSPPRRFHAIGRMTVGRAGSGLGSKVPAPVEYGSA